MAASKPNADGSYEWKCQMLKDVIPTLICSGCKAVPGPDLERSKRYQCVNYGHVLCPKCIINEKCTNEICKSKVSKVPSQQGQKLLEILPWFCHNYSSGCREIFDDKEKLRLHQEDCQFHTVHVLSALPTRNYLSKMDGTSYSDAKIDERTSWSSCSTWR